MSFLFITGADICLHEFVTEISFDEFLRQSVLTIAHSLILISLSYLF